MIGLSVSLCIKDILEGKAKEEDVEWIIAGTAVERFSEWAPVLKEYEKTYWQKDPREAEQILIRLLTADKILQPRLLRLPAPESLELSKGIWRK